MKGALGMCEFWTNFWMSVVAGVISGGFVSGAFYVLALRGQRRDMALLRNLHRITIQALENAKYIEVTRDSKGNPSGIKFRLDAGPGGFHEMGSKSEMAVQPQVADTGGMRSGGTATVEVVHPPAPPAENPGWLWTQVLVTFAGHP